jgi:hypothetical protein
MDSDNEFMFHHMMEEEARSHADDADHLKIIA